MELFFVKLFKGGVGKSGLYRPATFKPMSNSGITGSYFSLPLPQCKSLSVQREHSTVSFIVGVLAGRRPFTICRRVISVIVDSIKLKGGARSFAHVLKKVFKRIEPMFANYNPSTAIVSVITGIAVVASVFHLNPNSVLSGAKASMFFGVGISNGEAVFELHTNDLNKNKVICNMITKKEGYYYGS